MIIETAVCLAMAKALVMDRIAYWAREDGAYESMVDYIVRNESAYDSCAVGDRHVKEPSYGLAQINLHYNPSVTVAEATDPDFAIRYLIADLRAGKCSKWTTCRAFRNKYPNHPYFGAE